MQKGLASLGGVLLLFLTLVSNAFAVSDRINYQGVLNDGAGAPVTATVNMTFGIYGVPTGGTALWTETQSIQVSNGLFSVELGSVTPLAASIFLADDLYLGIQVDTDPEMSPRQRLTSVPHAFRAESSAVVSESSGGSPAAGTAEFTGTAAGLPLTLTVHSWSWGGSKTVSFAGGGVADPVTFQAVVLTIDGGAAALSTLHQLLFAETPVDTVTIQLPATIQTVMVLTDARVQSIQQGGSAGDQANAIDISLGSYATWELTTADSSAAWNVDTNSAIAACGFASGTKFVLAPAGGYNPVLYPDAIEIAAFSNGMTQSGAGSGGGGPTINVQDLSLVFASLPSFSPCLMHEVATSASIGELYVLNFSPVNADFPQMELKLTNAFATSVGLGAGAGGDGSANAAFTFEQLDWTFRDFEEDGSVGTTKTGSWSRP